MNENQEFRKTLKGPARFQPLSAEGWPFSAVLFMNRSENPAFSLAVVYKLW